MSKPLFCIAIVSAAFLTLPSLAWAGGATGTSDNAVESAPPARPAALTASQFEALLQVQASPEHAKVLGTSATYSAREESLKWTRFSDDVWTAIYQFGWPGTYLGFVLCAL